MTVEVMPLGVACNLGCTYCYQEPQRLAGNIRPKMYSLSKMIEGLKAEGGDQFTIFGGEPLLVPLEDLCTLWEFGLTLPARTNGIQTNGVLITDDHIEAFRKYNVRPGFSVDGPDELNDTRWAGTLEKTREATKKSQENIIKCLRAGVSAALITTLTSVNASREKLPRLIKWLEELNKEGVNHVNLHFLEVDTPISKDQRLSSEDLTYATLEIAKLMGYTDMIVEPVKAMTHLLLGDDSKADCVWHACDPYTTSAVQGVLGDGQRANCGRTVVDGVDWEKASQPSFIRQVALWNTPFEHGGCKDCKYFFACKGQCPGTALDNDWRNRTEHCQTIYSIFQHLENQLRSMGMQPISLKEETWRSLTERMVAEYAQDKRILLYEMTGACPSQHGNSHGDHFDGHGDSDAR